MPSPRARYLTFSLLPDTIAARAGDLRLCRINGRRIETWPAWLDTPAGRLEIREDGNIAFHGRVMPTAVRHLSAHASAFRFTYSLVDCHGVEGDLLDAEFELPSPGTGRARGWDAGWDSGLREADFFVDAENGSDENSGRTAESAKATVQAALDEMDPSGGQTLLLRTGTYSGAADFGRFSGATRPVIVARYGSDRPVISGAAPLPPLEPLDAEEAKLFGPDHDKVFRARLPAGTVSPERIESLGPCEGDRPLALATDQAIPVDPFLFGSVEAFHVARRFYEADDLVQAIEAPEVLGKYTPEQLSHATCVVWSRGNRLGRSAIAGTDAHRSNLIALSDPPRSMQQGNPQFWRFALRNVLPAIRPGGWAWRWDGNGDLLVYVRPVRESPSTGPFHYAAGTKGWELGAGSNIHLLGLEFADFSGATVLDGIAFGTIGSAARKVTSRDISLVHCRFRRVHNIEGAYGAVHLGAVERLNITRCTFETGQNAGLTVNQVRDMRISGCLFRKLTHAAVSAFNTHGVIFAHSDLQDLGRVAHSNVANFYGVAGQGGVDRVLFYGLRTTGTNGYITWQTASRVDMGFCDLSPPVLRNDLRVAVDQNSSRSEPPPATGEAGYFWNNLFRHNPEILDASGGALLLGRAGVDANYVLINNVIGGGGVQSPYAETSDALVQDRSRLNNIYTKLTWWQSRKSGWRLGTGETVISRLSNVFLAPNGRGFRLRADRALDGYAAHDMSAVVEAILSKRYPGFDFAQDIDGHEFDWQRARIGPFQMGWNIQIR